MPTLADYVDASELYDDEELALVPDDLLDQINAQLESASDDGSTDSTDTA